MCSRICLHAEILSVGHTGIGALVAKCASRTDWNFSLPSTSLPKCCLVFLFGSLSIGNSAALAALADAKRHPLEVMALTEPKAVLESLPPLIADAKTKGEAERLAKLELARANACRVIADWLCQRDAAAAASAAAKTAGAHHLVVRGLIAEARARVAMQDFSQGERVLGEAEAVLTEHPDAGLFADVMLAYSTMAQHLARHKLMRDYAERGLAALGSGGEPVIKARLLRNLGRASFELGDNEGADKAMRAAAAVAAPLDDPKLLAELDLMLAHIARKRGNVVEQLAAGERMLAVANRFGNAQAAAMGNEVIGYAAQANGDLVKAESSMAKAVEGYLRLGMKSEERQALRELLRIRLQTSPERRDAGAMMIRLMILDEAMDRRDRALAGDDFDARLRYAEQEFELKRLTKETEQAAEREKMLTASNRMRLVAIGTIVLGLAVVAALLVRQRRANARLKQSEAALAESQGHLRAITDAIPAIVSHVDHEQRYTFSNAFMHRLFGSSESQILGRTVREVRGEAIYASLEPHLQRALAGETVNFDGQAHIGDQDFHYQTSYIPDVDSTGQVKGLFALTFDITRLKRAEAQLEREARFDALTGAANRRQFEERLALTIASGRRQSLAIALMYLDIDHLKPVNDRYGHGAGDIVIRTFAARVTACLREGDLLARIGGDEFVVLTDHPDITGAELASEQIAGKILAALAEPMHYGEAVLPSGVSIGIAITDSMQQAATLMAEADRALYAAKAAGRNNFKCHVLR